MVPNYFHVHTCLYEGTPCMDCSVRGCDAVNRTMVQVVCSTCMYVWEYAYCGVWTRMNFLQVH
jgi:hypothetical protein